MAYSTPQINQILAKADRTMYKIGVVAYQNMFSELDEALDYNRDIIYIYKKAVEWGDDYFVGTEKLDKIVERLSGMIAVWDYGMLNPIYNDVAGIQISALPPCYFLVDFCDVNITNVQDGQYLTYDTETGKWINTGPGSAIRLSQTLTATQGQTVFVTASPFFVGLFDLYLNGVRLNSLSYTTFGNYSITLNDPCSAGDILDITTYDNNSSISSLLGLTTNGSTGVATLSGTVLNIPNYGLESISSAAVTGTTTKTLTLTKLSGSTITASWTDTDTGIVSLNGLGETTQTFATGTSGSDFNISSAAGIHTFNIPTASSTSRGALSSSDWSTFNSKQGQITLTTIGSSGASTFIGNTLNIPTYTIGGLGAVPTSRTLTINGITYDLTDNRTWSVGTVTSVDMSVPTGFSISGNPITSSGTLALAFASGYSLPTNIKQSNWDDAYTWVANFPSQTGNGGKYLTTDGSTLSWGDSIPGFEANFLLMGA